jgi:hypothetical protein
MSSARRLLGLLVALALMSLAVTAQTLRSEDDPRNLAPTVNGGTGLFTVYDAQTLRRGEFNFGFFANFFHRDPGDVRFQNYNANFQVGLSDWLEFFISLEAQRKVVVRRPEVLSGFYLPDVRTRTLAPGRVVIDPRSGVIGAFISDPCGNGGFLGPCTRANDLRFGPFQARPSGNDTAVYPGLGAPVGGILPAIPANVVPSYLPNAPFISRFVGTGVGDLWLGGKIRLTPPNNAFGFTLVPVFKIPTTRTLNTGLERGRGTGAFDYGLTLALDGRLNKYINLSTNVGFIKKGDPRAADMNLGALGGGGVPQGFGRSERALDLPNEWRSGIGVDFPLSQYLQFAVEVTATRYVGSRTPSLLMNNPVDFIGGARIYPARWLAIHAAYQRHLNWQEGFALNNSSPNGFIFGLSIGHVNDREPAVLPNQPPTVALEVGSVTAVATNVVRASASTVCVGDTVALAARASDPDGDTLLYRWTTSGGRITGEGANVTFDSTGLAPGDYTVTVEVDDKYGGVAFDSKTVRVENCPPNIITPNPYLDVSPASSTVNAGEAVNFSTSGVSGGQNYGNVTYNWTTSAGTIQGSGLSARLDTTGVAPGMIRIEVRATIEALNWWVGSGSAAVTVVVYHSRPPEARRLSTCNDFSRGRPIVPGTCQAHLDQAVQQLQTEQSAELWVWVFHSENEQNTLGYDRARHVESYLADSIRRRQLDANRFRVTAFGTSTDGSQVVVWFIPALATRPDAPHAMTSPTDFGRPHRRQGQRQAQRDRVGQRAQARARRHHRRALRPGRPRERVPRR